MTEETQQTPFVSFSAEVNPKTAEGLLGLCADLANKGTKTVHLLLSTPGGSVMHGINIYNVLRGMPFELITHNVSSVNSIGNVIFLAGDKRYAVPSSTFMFHGVGIDARDGMRLEERFLRERLDSIGADHNRIASIISERANFPEDEDIADLFLQEATKDTAYAIERGIIHDVRDVKVPSGAPILQLVFQRQVVVVMEHGGNSVVHATMARSVPAAVTHSRPALRLNWMLPWNGGGSTICTPFVRVVQP